MNTNPALSDQSEQPAATVVPQKTKPKKKKKVIKRKVVKRTFTPAGSRAGATTEKDETECRGMYSRALILQRDGMHSDAASIYTELLSRKTIVESVVDESWMNPTDQQLTEEDMELIPLLKKRSEDVSRSIFLYLKFLSLKNLSTIYTGAEALKCLKSAVLIDGTDPNLWYKIGRISFEVGDWSMCRHSLEQCILFSEDHQLAWECLAEVLYTIGDFDSCAWVARKILSKHEDEHIEDLLNKCTRLTYDFDFENDKFELKQTLWASELQKEAGMIDHLKLTIAESSIFSNDPEELQIPRKDLNWASFIQLLLDCDPQQPNSLIKLSIKDVEDVEMQEAENKDKTEATQTVTTNIDQAPKPKPTKKRRWAKLDLDDKRSRPTEESSKKPQKGLKDLINAVIVLNKDESADENKDNSQSQSNSNPEKEQNEMFEALLMPFLDPLLGAPHGLLDVMKKVLEFFLEHYEMRWTADIKDVCSDVVKQQIPLSTKGSIAMAEVLYDHFEQSPTDNQPSFVQARKLLNKMNIKGIVAHLNEQEIFDDLEVKDQIRLLYIIGLIEHRSRNHIVARDCFSRCSTLFTENGFNQIALPNCNKINVIELELLDTKIKELDLGNSVLDIAKIVDDEKYKQGLDQFTPQLINGLRNSAMEDKARDLLFRCVSHVPDLNIPKKALISICTYLLSGITVDLVREHPEEVYSILHNICSKTEHANFTSTDITLALIDVADVLDRNTAAKLSGEYAASIACVFILIHRFAMFLDEIRKSNILAFARYTYIINFRARTRLRWFFDKLIIEMAKALRAVEERILAATDIASEEDVNQFERVTTELHKTIYIYFGVKLSAEQKPYESKDVKEHKFKDEPLTLFEDKRMTQVAFESIQDEAEEKLQKGNLQIRTHYEKILGLIFNAFNKLPSETEECRVRIKETLDDDRYKLFLSEKEIRIPNAHLKDNPYRDVFENVHRLLGEYYFKNYQLGLGNVVPLFLNANSKEYANSVYFLEKACACTPKDPKVWLALASRYGTLLEAVKDVSDLVDQYKSILHERETRELLRLPTLENPSDEETVKDFFSTLAIVTRRGLMANKIAIQLLNNIPDSASEMNEARLSIATILYTMLMIRRFNNEDKETHPVFGKISDDVIRQKLLEYLAQCEGTTALVMEAHVIELTMSRREDDYMPLYVKAAEQQLEATPTLKTKDLNPLYRLHSARAKLLERHPQRAADVLKWTVTIPTLPSDKVLLDGVPKSASELKLPSTFEGFSSIDAWQNVLDSLISILRVYPTHHKTLYYVSRVLAKGPWQDWNAAMKVMSCIIKKRKTSGSKPELFDFKIWVDESEQADQKQQSYRYWKGKCTTWYADVLRKTQDLEEMSALSSGFRRARLEEDKYLYAEYRYVLLIFARVMEEKMQQAPNAELMRYLGEIYVYLNDPPRSSKEDLTEVNKSKEVLWGLIKTFGVTGETDQARVTNVCDYVFEKFGVDLLLKGTRTKKKEKESEEKKVNHEPSPTEGATNAAERPNVEKPKAKRRRIHKSTAVDVSNLATPSPNNATAPQPQSQFVFHQNEFFELASPKGHQEQFQNTTPIISPSQIQYVTESPVSASPTGPTSSTIESTFASFVLAMKKPDQTPEVIDIESDEEMTQ